MSDTVALDFLLQSIMASGSFNANDTEYWDGISLLIPGFTAKQVKMRYEELLQSSPWFHKARSNEGGAREKSEPGMDSKDQSAAVSSISQMKTEINPNSLRGNGKPSFKDSPVMVIHVCDEAKGVKQDFHCPRDLLVTEMKYFAEYLSTEQQRSEEVDISVHCDVQIFEWLMCYAKRNLNKGKTPQLEPTNAVSILISSDFLKMDSLVELCIDFCHKNMSGILATPCNMNCINDKLLTSIAEKFTDAEADAVRDKKDKFVSKIFTKKIERLFDPQFKSPEVPDNAATLYRCAACHRLLTRALERRLRCIDSRMSIDSRGQLAYRHLRDPTWDVNEHILDLRNQLPTWREIYWRLWGSANYLNCSRCGEAFPCIEFGHCRYHPEPARFDSANEENSVSLVGVYPCCGTKTLRFDPLRRNKGCRVRDHLVSTIPANSTSKPPVEASGKVKVYEALLSHRDAICVPFEPLEDEDEHEVDLYASEQLLLDRGPKTCILSDDIEGKTGPKLQPLTFEADIEDEDLSAGDSDDEVGDEETLNLRHVKRRPRNVVTVQADSILVDAPAFGTKKTKKWDTSKSLRTNQDAQRQEDRRRMAQIIDYLTKLRLNIDKNEKVKPKEYSGGIFSRLEAQWKAQNCPPVARIPPMQPVRGKTKLASQFR